MPGAALLTLTDLTTVTPPEPYGQGDYVIAERKVPPNAVEEFLPGARFFARVRAAADLAIDPSAESQVVNVPGYSVRVPELGVESLIEIQGIPVYEGPPASPPANSYYIVVQWQNGVARQVTVYKNGTPTAVNLLHLLYFPAQGLLKWRIRRKETGVSMYTSKPP